MSFPGSSPQNSEAVSTIVTPRSTSTIVPSSDIPPITYLPINPKVPYLGPLTTIFTPPTTCWDIKTQWHPTDTSLVIFHGVWGDPKCYPGDARVLGQNYGAFFYSPGVCPSGFTAACQDRQQWNPTLVEITASFCCPTGFGCKTYNDRNNTAPECTSTALTPITKVWAGDKANPTGVPSDAVFYTLTPPRAIWMNAIPIAWESTDESVRALATRTSFLISSNAITSSSLTTSTPGSGGSVGAGGNSGGGLSKGGKIAIGVTVPIIIVGCLLLIRIIMRRKRKPEVVTNEYAKAELPTDNDRNVVMPPREMDAVEQEAYRPYHGPPIELAVDERDR